MRVDPFFRATKLRVTEGGSNPPARQLPSFPKKKE
jgi:hypothetical protein